MQWLEWFTKFENTKPLGLVIFFVTFVLIVAYVYGSKERRERLESYKNVPFLDEDTEGKEDRQ